MLDSAHCAKYLRPMTQETETLDALGLLCPLPVLKARKRLKSMPAGSVLRLLADDPAAVVDVPHFCAESGHELVAQQDMSDHQVYLIRKSA
ncbi:tRNA 2-thiouridine synthesizing protein A [Ruegeria intermedia]|uniref:tRNA 2-thiouridine synthesizing protein A n=2 Tax=Ruegeria intermedia TaxID=996115 RepID=A0A1M4VHE2_9RHOB|nr:tRNA 2-thiouridine synthesizing protein A [Ruegeria intermedia]